MLLPQGLVRAGGDAEALDQGRAAQKRIRDAKKRGGEPSAADKTARNQARKARKKASKASRQNAEVEEADLTRQLTV